MGSLPLATPLTLGKLCPVMLANILLAGLAATVSAADKPTLELFLGSE